MEKSDRINDPPRITKQNDYIQNIGRVDEKVLRKIHRNIKDDLYLNPKIFETILNTMIKRILEDIINGVHRDQITRD